MNLWRTGDGWECMFDIARSLELRALPYALNPPPRAAASFNKALQRTGADRFSFMSHWFYNIIGFGGAALPAPVAELDRSA